MALFQAPLKPQGDVHVDFRAGKCEWDGKVVTAGKTKGRVVLFTSEEDGQVHFQWIDREKNDVALDLIFFNNAYFQKIEKCKDGRVFLLRMTDSDAKHFFWLQESKTEGDDDLMKKFNEKIGAKIPDKKSGGAAGAPAAGVAAALASGASAGANAEVNPELRAALEALLQAQGGAAGGAAAGQRQAPVPLNAVMTTEVLQGLMDDAEAVKEMQELLPAGQRSSEDLRQALGSPQLQQNLSSLTQAIHSDQLPVLFASLGLDPSAIATAAPGSDALEVLIRAMEAQQKK